jgi:hypothetical protein
VATAPSAGDSDATYGKSRADGGDIAVTNLALICRLASEANLALKMVITPAIYPYVRASRAGENAWTAKSPRSGCISSPAVAMIDPPPRLVTLLLFVEFCCRFAADMHLVNG